MLDREVKGFIPCREDGTKWGDDEYFKYDALHSSELAKFVDFPDKLSIKVEQKGYFNLGHAFEYLVEDQATGSKKFAQHFFISELETEPPDEILQAIEDGVDLESLKVYNKNGELNKTKKRLHSWVYEYQNKGVELKPIIEKDYEMLLDMLDSFFMMKIEVFGTEYKLEELLKNAEYQVPIVWTDNMGIEKQALVDVVVRIDNYYIALDIKTAVDEIKFEYRVKDQYWVQDRHYIEALHSIYGDNVAGRMIFITSFKTAPYHARPYVVRLEDVDKLTELYDQACRSWNLWKLTGKRRIGYKKQKEVRIFNDDYLQYNIDTNKKSVMDLL